MSRISKHYPPASRIQGNSPPSIDIWDNNLLVGAIGCHGDENGLISSHYKDQFIATVHRQPACLLSTRSAVKDLHRVLILERGAPYLFTLTLTLLNPVDAPAPRDVKIDADWLRRGSDRHTCNRGGAWLFGAHLIDLLVVRVNDQQIIAASEVCTSRARSKLRVRVKVKRNNKKLKE